MSQAFPISLPDPKSCNITVVGLGYVGLPLSVAFASCFSCASTSVDVSYHVTGYDVNHKRVTQLNSGHDYTSEVTATQLLDLGNRLSFTSEIDQLGDADVFIITVPTPVDHAHIPDLTALLEASHLVGQLIAASAHDRRTIPVVIYESTVYPGATEEVCIPALIASSGLEFNIDFFVGYSPERVNPGDASLSLSSIAKVTSGSTLAAALFVDRLYQSIIVAGTYLAPSIKVAEAAKVVENTQRDLNIAFVNELAIMFSHMGIDTRDVLDAASTKWNFHNYTPGLVGGHCIGIDPYYLTYKSEVSGYYPDVILSARRINDGMGRWVSERLIETLVRRHQLPAHSSILVLGFSFKENCPDIRNTRIFDSINHLLSYGVQVTIVDPVVDLEECLSVYGLTVHNSVPLGSTYTAVLVALAHHQFLNFDQAQWLSLLQTGGFIFDLKCVVPRELGSIRI